MSEIFLDFVFFLFGISFCFLFIRSKKANELKELKEQSLNQKHEFELEKSKLLQEKESIKNLIEEQKIFFARSSEEKDSNYQSLKQELENQKQSHERKLETHKKETKDLEIELERKITRLDEEIKNLLREKSQLQTEKKNLEEKFLKQEKRQENLEKNLKEFLLKELENASFKLNENSVKKLDFSIEKISSFNKEKLSDILNPVKEKISSFEFRIQNFQDKNTKESSELRASLEEKIKTLNNLNQQISKDAQNLTKALTTDKKKQGNWGEMILETLLEHAGLQKGVTYFSQKKFTEEETRKSLIPDFVIQLPNQQKVIIDSKVSLESYRKYINSEIKEEQEKFLKEHVRAIRSHIDTLGSKSYEGLLLEKESKFLKFVLMFLPIEPAFIEAVRFYPDLFQEAYSKNIILTSPSTVFSVFKIISEIWYQENQNKNTQKIVEEAVKIYDKCRYFLEGFEKFGKNVDSLKENYEKSINRLSSGKGNIIVSCKKLKELGVNPKKPIEGFLSKPLLERIDSAESSEVLY